MTKNILVDARELVPGKLTGIGRVLIGLVDALIESQIVDEISFALDSLGVLPSKLKNRRKIRIKGIPTSFLRSEHALSALTKNHVSLFISPYPKLPLFGCHCPTVHIIHDVLDLTHPAYRRYFKTFFDKFRLKRALKKSDLTWYDSSWSLSETGKYVGLTGKNPRVRYPGLNEKFRPDIPENQHDILKKYQLQQGYILVIGNGLPHKNLGVLLEIYNKISREFVFLGVSQEKQSYWKTRYPNVKALWIEHLPDEDLPSVLQKAFCLAQPSTAEGYGYPPLEAMACGIPVVASKIPVLVETTGGNAMVADPDTPKEWLAAFEALESDALNQKQVEKGRKWVEPLCGLKGWQKHISDIEELIMEEQK
jgi:glycosyltransferase involved in cell wall biosynthesis